MAAKHNLIVTAVLVPALIYFQLGDENRLVRSLEARGYTDVQIEHPNQWHCSRRNSTYSYRARLPNGAPVHGGACVFFYFFITTTEPIGKKYSARQGMGPFALAAADRYDPQPKPQPQTTGWSLEIETRVP